MEKKDTIYKNVFNRTTKIYLLFLFLILALIMGKHFFVQYLLSQQADTSNTINMAGKQRMLSQKITKDAFFISRNKDKGELEYYGEDLEESILKFKEAHDNLVHKENSDSITYLFDEIEPFYINIVNSGDQIVHLLKEDPLRIDFESIAREAEVIRKNEFFFLENMDDIVFQYEVESTTALENMRFLDNLIIMFIMFLFIITMIIFIKPIREKEKKAFRETKENNINITKMFNTMKNPLFIIDKSGEIILTNSKAREIMNNDSSNVKESMKWLDINIGDFISNVLEKEKIEGREVRIKDSQGEERFILLSGVTASYKGQEVLFLTLNDYTLQKKAEEKMRNIAIKDELTGLYNRRYLDMIIEEEIEKSERYDIPISLFILDLDHFKKVNDDWGHPVGDSVLQLVAEIISKSTRLSDYHFRIGGEEFLVIMPHTKLNGAYNAAEKLRLEIERAFHPVAGKFTASFGVAERKKGETYHQLYQEADSALYRAKEAGRNCVISFTQEENEETVLQWQEAWNSGERKIDAQHQELFLMASKLLEEHAYSSKKEEVLKYFDDITQHVKEHFIYEEKILEKVKYENFYHHKQLHIELLKKTMVIRNQIKEEMIDVTKVFAFLYDELIVGHFLKEDVKFFPLVDRP